jgi:hypothetical protein
VVWPALVRPARRRGAVLLFGDAACFAPWDSLGYTWAPSGEQPRVPTGGTRQGDQVCGLLDYLSGRLSAHGHTGRCTAERYCAFLATVLAATEAVPEVAVAGDGAPADRVPLVLRIGGARRPVEGEAEAGLRMVVALDCDVTVRPARGPGAGVRRGAARRAVPVEDDHSEGVPEGAVGPPRFEHGLHVRVHFPPRPSSVGSSHRRVPSRRGGCTW